MFDAQSELVDTQEQGVDGHQRDVAAEEYEILLVFLPDTVVDPGTSRMEWNFNDLTVTKEVSQLTSGDPF